MNLYELIDDLYHAHSYLRAGDDGDWPYTPVRQMLDAYVALEPDWTNAPEWAQWVTVFDNGKRVWWEIEPISFIDYRGDYAWREKGTCMGMAKSEKTDPLPLGVDWRLCKWQRQQPLSTHNNSLSDQEPTP